ncbi:hypothetical protein L1887_60218 [Cichorium endivia]|nr:hypothetical protein L1887_60218 [Cichorium endivia]
MVVRLSSRRLGWVERRFVGVHGRTPRRAASARETGSAVARAGCSAASMSSLCEVRADASLFLLPCCRNMLSDLWTNLLRPALPTTVELIHNTSRQSNKAVELATVCCSPTGAAPDAIAAILLPSWSQMPSRWQTPSVDVCERIVAGRSGGQGVRCGWVVIQDAIVEVVAAWRICASVSACRKSARVPMQRGWIITLISLGSILGAIVNRYGYGGDLNGEGGRLESTQSHPPPALARAHSSDRTVAPCHRKSVLGGCWPKVTSLPKPRSLHAQLAGTLDVLASLQCECSLEPLASSNARVLGGTSGILKGSAELCFLLPEVTCSDGLLKNQGCSLSQRRSSCGTQLRQAAWLATGPKKKTSRLRERVEPAAASTCGAGKQVKTHRHRHEVSRLRRSRVWLACGLQLTEALPGRLCHWAQAGERTGAPVEMISASRRHHRPALITTYSNTYSPRCKSHKQHQPYRRYKEHRSSTQPCSHHRLDFANPPHEPRHDCRQHRCITSHRIRTAHLHQPSWRITRD